MIDYSDWIVQSEYACAEELRCWLDHVAETALSWSRPPAKARPPVGPESKPRTAPAWIADAIRDLPPLCTAKEAASFLRVSERTLARYMASGLLKAVQRAAEGSARVLVPRTEIALYLSRLQ